MKRFLQNLDKKLLGAIVLLIVAFSFLAKSTTHTVTLIDENRPFGLIPQDSQQTAPDFTLTTADGQSVTLSQAVKKGPVILDFWATWCGPCREEMPELQKVYNTYKGRGVQLYGVNSSDNSKIVGEFSHDYHMEFPTLVDSQQTAHDEYGIEAIPFVVVIDTNMHIAADNDGYDPDTKTDLPKTLDEVLGS